MEWRHDDTAYVVMRTLFREEGPLPALYVSVEVSVEGFEGRNDRVAIEVSELESFITALRVMSSARSGSANLNSLSPGLFKLTCDYVRELPSSAVTGPIVITVSLKKVAYLAGKRFDISTNVGWEEVPSSLPTMIAALEALLAI